MIQLEPCDIFFSAGEDWLSHAIRWRTRRRREAPSVVNHVGLVTAAGSLHSAEVVEALLGGARRGPLGERYAGTGMAVAVFRPLNLTSRDRELIVAHALSYDGKRYGVGKIVAHAIGLPSLGRADNWPICSFVVARAFSRAGYYFNVDAYPNRAPGSASPDDIWDFCLERPDRYAPVWSLAPIPAPTPTAPPAETSRSGAVAALLRFTAAPAWPLALATD